MNFILRLLYIFIGEPSADKALANLNKALAKLENAVNFQHNKAVAAAKAAEFAAKVEADAKIARDKAERVAAKIGDLLS